LLHNFNTVQELKTFSDQTFAIIIIEKKPLECGCGCKAQLKQLFRVIHVINMTKDE